MDAVVVAESARALAVQFAKDRPERQRRRELDPADFERLRETGFLLTGVPREQGGLWESAPRSIRTVCDIVRTLAHGDPSVALVCSMHPAVLSAWLTTPEAPAPHREAWEAQRGQVFETARGGALWGTIASEPGTGGDITKTRTVARPDGPDGRYRLTGQKNFGSGSGMTAFMITSARPAGEAEPDFFVLDLRDVPWDGSAGLRLTAAWDGHGMIGSQSHAMALEGFPATRVAWPANLPTFARRVGGVAGCVFTCVIVGVVETAVEAARAELGRRRGELRAFEQVEWSRAELEAWLVQQAYEGMLRAVERGEEGPRDVVMGKTAVAELAESALRRICRVIGGGTFSRHSPFGFWLEDVRALGFLRPTWGLAYERLFEGSWTI